MFDSLFGTANAVDAAAAATATTTSLNIEAFAICTVAAVAMGIVLAFAYMFRGRYTKSFVITLAMLPAIVAVVIMMVNGNIGAGVAVAGAFSLVRFRSAPGSAKDISFIFLAMAVGLVCGMGYLGYAACITAIMCVVYLLLTLSNFGQAKSSPDRTLRVTIPEDLDYNGLLTDLFAQYTTYHELVDVRTTNMGSLFRLTYNVGIAHPEQEKAFIDEIRCRNGNLEVALMQQAALHNEL